MTKKNEDILDDYKLLKLEFWQYLEGVTRGNWGTKDKLRNYFRHLEDMVFGEDVSINDISRI